MKVFTALAIGLILLVVCGFAIGRLTVSPPVVANLYTAGTQFHGMVSKYESLLPDQMSLLIILEDQRPASVNQLNLPLIIELPDTKDLVAKAFSKPWSNDVSNSIAYMGMLEKDDQSLCIIRAKSERALKVSLFHEIMHCITDVNVEWKQFTRAARPISSEKFKADDGEYIGRTITSHVLVEAHAIILEHVVMQKTGIIGDIPSLVKLKKAQYPENPAKNSIESGLEICMKYNCPLDPSELMSILARQPDFMEAMKFDLNIAYEYSLSHVSYR